MPIEHKTFGCTFKCGRRHSPTISVIATHEKTCWHNPELKTCISCSNQIFRKGVEYHDELPGSPREEWVERGCLHPYGDKFIEDNYEALTTKSGYIKPVVNCPVYNQTVEGFDPETHSGVVSRIKDYQERIDDELF